MKCIISAHQSNANGTFSASIHSVLHRICEEFVEDQSKWHRGIIGKFPLSRITNDIYAWRKQLSCSLADRTEKFLRIEPCRIAFRIENLLRRSHCRNSTTCVV